MTGLGAGRCGVRIRAGERHSVDSVVTGLGAGRCGVRIPAGERRSVDCVVTRLGAGICGVDPGTGRFFLYPKTSRPPREGHPAPYPVHIGVKQPGREVDHSLVSSAEVKN